MSNAKKIAVAAVCIALAFLLNQVAIFRMPMGGSVTPFSMLFIVLAGYWLGSVHGIVSGVALGLLDTATGAYVVHPFQYMLDYIWGFGALGLSGFFRKWKFGLPIGYVVGVFGRFVMVFLSGYIFFYMWAPEGQHAAVYSLIYNITYIGPEMVVSLVVLSLPAMSTAINSVTKMVVPPKDYEIMMRNANIAISPNAYIVSGIITGSIGGMFLTLASHVRRIEELRILQWRGELISFESLTSNIIREIGRHSEQIIALSAAGIFFIALGAGLFVAALTVAINKNQQTDKKL